MAKAAPQRRDTKLLALCEALGVADVAEDVELAERDRTAWFARHARRLRLERRMSRETQLPKDAKVLSAVAFLDALESRGVVWSADWKASAEEIGGLAAALAKRARLAKGFSRVRQNEASLRAGSSLPSLRSVQTAPFALRRKGFRFVPPHVPCGDLRQSFDEVGSALLAANAQLVSARFLRARVDRSHRVARRARRVRCIGLSGAALRRAQGVAARAATNAPRLNRTATLAKPRAADSWA